MTGMTGMTGMNDIKSNYATPDCVTITAKSIANNYSVSTPKHSHRRQKSDSRQNESNLGDMKDKLKSI